MTLDRGAVLRAWLDARWSMAALTSRAAIERRQARLWRRLQPVLRRTPALAGFSGGPLSALPVVDALTVRGDFERWNSVGLSRAEADAAALASETGSVAAPGGVQAGFSTGSEGARGVFLSSPAERARYIGQSLARLLPARALWQGRRIALVLRASNRLYADVETAGPFRFRHYGLDRPIGELADALAGFDPHVLIAPAHVLAELARLDPAARRLASVERLYWGAEPMGAGERDWIAGRLGRRPEPIYQATEGFLAAPCSRGVLHLNEDALVVELEPVEGAPCRRPIVTDLFRSSQPMVRVRLDDLVRPLGPCACGSALQAVAPVEGRVGDLWRWPERTVTPFEVNGAVEAMLGPAARWRAVGAPDGVTLECEQAPADVEALRALAGGRPVRVSPLHRDGGPKRRRVRWAA